MQRLGFAYKDETLLSKPDRVDTGHVVRLVQYELRAGRQKTEEAQYLSKSPLTFFNTLPFKPSGILCFYQLKSKSYEKINF